MADTLPLVVFPARRHASPADRAASLRSCAARYLPRLGSILFRGFRVYGWDELQPFAAAFGAAITVAHRDVLARESGGGRLWIACTGSPAACLDAKLADSRELRAMLSTAVRTHLLERGLRERDFGPLFQRGTVGRTDGELDEGALEANSVGGVALAPFAIAELVSAWRVCAARVDWEPGDVLLVDRMRTAVCVPSAQQRELLFATDDVQAAALNS